MYRTGLNFVQNNSINSCANQAIAEKAHKRVLLHADLDRLVGQHALSDVIDTLADIAAERAEGAEHVSRDLAEEWDKACGKLCVVGNATRV